MSSATFPYGVLHKHQQPKKKLVWSTVRLAVYLSILPTGYQLAWSLTHCLSTAPEDAWRTQTSFSVSPADGGRGRRVARSSLGEVRFFTFQLGNVMAVEGLYLPTQYNTHRNFKRAFVRRRVQTNTLSGASCKRLCCCCCCFCLSELDQFKYSLFYQNRVTLSLALCWENLHKDLQVKPYSPRSFKPLNYLVVSNFVA